MLFPFFPIILLPCQVHFVNNSVISSTVGIRQLPSHCLVAASSKGSRIILELKNYDIVDDNKLSGLNGAKLIKMSNKLTIVSEEHASIIYKLIFEE